MMNLMKSLSLAAFTALFVNACGVAPEEAQLSFDEAVVKRLYGDKRLDQMSFVTSHNAFVNNGDGAWLAANQSQGIQKQLEDGVRSLMLDIHSYKGKATLCHGSCTGIPLINPRMDLAKTLRTVADFLGKNPEAVVTIFIEDYSSRDEMRKVLDEVPAFKNLMFNPYAEQVRERGWPKLRDMVAKNRRLLVISDRADKKELGIGFGQDLTVENYWSMGALAKDRQCRSRWDHIPLDRRDGNFERLFVMNHFRDIPTMITAEIDNRSSDIWERMERECVSAAGRKPNFIAVDFHNWAGNGAHQTVERLNKTVGILFKDRDFKGSTQMLERGSISDDNLIFGNDSVTSIKIFAPARVKLFRNAAFQDLLLEVTKDTPYVGDAANDQTSSVVIE